MSRRVDDNLVDPRRAGELMRRALANAMATRPHPNPRVGAVVVATDGTIAAEAAHSGPGSPHAEAHALAAAGSAAAGSTLYVTLEPCDHHGRTPPCTEAIIDAGVSRVVVGTLDPDVRVSGRGVERLRRAGIDVQVGVPGIDAEGVDEAYFHHRRTGLPFVTVKVAGTLDGQAAARDGTSQWITGEAARADAHRLRADNDAVMIGAGTLRVDDPRLDVRLDDHDGPQPRPVVIAGRRPLPATRVLYDRSPLIVASEPRTDVPAGAELVLVSGDDGLVAPDAALEALGKRDIVALMVEGGPHLAGAFVRAGLANRVVVYLGAKLAGGAGLPVLGGEFPTLGAARAVTIDRIERLGDDLRIDLRPVRGAR